MRRSYEKIRAELDDILERYRSHTANKSGLTYAEAVRLIRKLGFTEGDAVRWLGSKSRPESLPRKPK